MNLIDLKQYCLQKSGVSETYPFDEVTLVFKVSSKMFALTNIKDEILRINLKCEPLLAFDLREEFDSVVPGYHMNKLHWNTVFLNGTIPEDRVLKMIDHSYQLVVKGLKKSEKIKLGIII